MGWLATRIRGPGMRPATIASRNARFANGPPTSRTVVNPASNVARALRTPRNARSASSSFTVRDLRATTKSVRSIARVWILPYAYMVKESSGIKTLADLKGKRVIVKFKTNVSLAQANRTILSTAGLTESDVTPVESGGVVASIGMVAANVSLREDGLSAEVSVRPASRAPATSPRGAQPESSGLLDSAHPRRRSV